MCGIAGFISNKSVTKEDYKGVLQLTVLNESRGDQSTGLAMVTKTGDCHLYKGVVKSSLYTNAVLKDKFIEDTNILLSHTRFATVGAVTVDNAHPFRFGSIVGVHNGHVNNHSQIGKFEVDSMAIFELLSRENNDFDKVFPKLSGTFAIAWVDLTNPDTLYLVKHGNPIYTAITERGLFFSSQEDSVNLVSLCDSSSRYVLEDDKVYTLKSVEGKIKAFSVDVEFKKGYYNNYGFYNGEARETNYGNYKSGQLTYDYDSLDDGDDGGYSGLWDGDMTGFFITKRKPKRGCDLCGCSPASSNLWWRDKTNTVICDNCYEEMVRWDDSPGGTSALIVMDKEKVNTKTLILNEGLNK